MNDPDGSKMEVVGSVFRGPGKQGDFLWMIEQPEYATTLFAFNDNQEQFLAFRQDPGSGRGCDPGGGNAAVRPYRCAHPARAAGIPTGVNRRGYPQLTGEVRDLIDDAIKVVNELTIAAGYQQIVYSAADNSGQLGTGIFEVGTDVKEYVVEKLKSLADQTGPICI